VYHDMCENELILTREQVRHCDVVAVEKFNIPSIVLMENAGIGGARIIADTLKKFSFKQVLIVCGSGNNGGDGYVVARHLVNNGFVVTVVIACEKNKICGDALTHLTVIEKMGINIIFVGDDTPLSQSILTQQINHHDLIVDALLGTGLTQAVRAPIALIIEQLNRSQKVIISLDLPSGLDCDTGCPLGCSIIAQMTITFVALKKGFQIPSARKYTGNIEVVGIGIDAKLLVDI